MGYFLYKFIKNIYIPIDIRCVFCYAVYSGYTAYFSYFFTERDLFMSKKRMFSLLLCAILMSSAVTGCSGGGDTVQTSAETEAVVSGNETEADTEKIAFYVTGIDYEGYEFRVWNFDNYKVNTWDPKDIPNDLYSTELTGDVLNDAVFTRNKNVEEALLVGD